jgi:hypothetical protein
MSAIDTDLSFYDQPIEPIGTLPIQRHIYTLDDIEDELLGQDGDGFPMEPIVNGEESAEQSSPASEKLEEAADILARGLLENEAEQRHSDSATCVAQIAEESVQVIQSRLDCKRSLYSSGSRSITASNEMKCVPGNPVQIQENWRVVLCALSERYNMVDAVLFPLLFLPPPARGSAKGHRGTHKDSIEVASAKIITNGDRACSLIVAKNGQMYVPLNDFREIGYMPMRIDKCYHLVASNQIAYLALSRLVFEIPSVLPSGYFHSMSRTPLLSTSIILYLAKMCQSSCTGTAKNHGTSKKRCNVPWCWTLRSTINPKIFQEIFELLHNDGVFPDVQLGHVSKRKRSS